MTIEILQSHGTIDKPEVLVAPRRDVDLEQYKVRVEAKVKVPDSMKGKVLTGFRNARRTDVSRLLLGNWLVWDPDLDKVVIAYLIAPMDSDPLAAVLNSVKWTESDRNDGTPSRARVAGWLERHHARPGREGCTLARLHRDNPAAAQAVIDYAAEARKWYAAINPDLFATHAELTEKVFEKYRMGDSPFTSAIVNKDNVLPFHYDAGNFKDVWSMMLGLKRGVAPNGDGDAGELVLPQYDLALGVENNSLSGFDGQVALHGVTPFGKSSRTAYRYTIVWYSKVGMWACLPPDEELRAARQRRNQKEQTRYNRGQEPMPLHYVVPAGFDENAYQPTRSDILNGGHWRCKDCQRKCYCAPAFRQLPHLACGQSPSTGKLHYVVPPEGLAGLPPKNIMSGPHWQCPSCKLWCYCPPGARSLPHNACELVPA